MEVRLGEALAQGTLFPLRLAGYGKLPLYYPQYYLQEGLLDVKSFFLYEEGGTYHLTGEAQVVRARLAFPEEAVRRLGQEGVAAQEGGGAKVPLVFDRVHLYAERGVLVQESLAQGELAGDLYLGGTYGDPYLSGEVWPLWGSFRLWDALFSLDPGQSRLYFSPDRGILPRFALGPGGGPGIPGGPCGGGEFLRENGRVKVRLEPTFSSTPAFPGGGLRPPRPRYPGREPPGRGLPPGGPGGGAGEPGPGPAGAGALPGLGAGPVPGRGARHPGGAWRRPASPWAST